MCRRESQPRDRHEKALATVALWKGGHVVIIQRRHFTVHRDRDTTMLNLAFLFDDAIDALTRYAEDLVVVPLPAAVYMMQVDVVNHYHHALEHYLTVPLDAPFLQDSSLGTPYQKWARHQAYWI